MISRIPYQLVPGRYSAPIAADWLPLWQLLPQRPFRIALSRFVRFCSTGGIAPCDVTPATFDAFEHALERESLIAGASARCRDTRRFWNEAAGRFVGWPKLEVPVRDRRARYLVDLCKFPASFAADLEAYRVALTRDDPDLESSVRPIKAVSAASKLALLHRLASAAVDGGVVIDSIVDLAAVVRPEVVKAGLREMRRRNGKDKLKSFDALLAHVLSTARHWVQAPDEEIEQLTRLKKSLNIDTYVMAESTERVLRDLEDPATLRALVKLPGRVFERLDRVKEHSRRDAVRAQLAPRGRPPPAGAGTPQKPGGHPSRSASPLGGRRQAAEAPPSHPRRGGEERRDSRVSTRR